ncbi:MAG: hypothetical protein MR350_00605 [Alphaproteobacteria bacterium]|nr:hypothetical protein [Alphaproteobacteria bacterium]
MNIKFFTIFLSLLLIANPSFAEGNEETTDFGLDEPVVDTAEEVIETVEEIPDAAADAAVAVEVKSDEVQPAESSEAPVLLEKENTVEEPVANAESLQQQLDKNQVQLSEYAKALNLQTSQLDAAKEISEEGRLRQMQLMQNIEQLKEQIKSLENKNLEKFKKILTPEQLEVFDKLQSTYENNLNLKEQLNKTETPDSSVQ